MGTPWGHQEEPEGPEGHLGDVTDDLKDMGTPQGQQEGPERDLKDTM